MKYLGLKKIIKRTSLIFTVILISIIFGFHNDNTNLFFKNKINTRLKQHLGFDFGYSINKIANTLDIKGKFLSINYPIIDSNIVDLTINYKQLDSLRTRKKKWININILIDDTLQSAKLKFHGTSNDHYLDGKYSFRIKMKKNSKQLNGMKVFNLIKAEQGDPTIIAVNKLAAKLNLISPNGRMVMLNINNKSWGAYYLVERISDEFLYREFSISKYAKLSNVTDWTRKETKWGTDHISDFDLYYGHIKSNKSPLHPIAIGKYKKMCSLVRQRNSQELTKLFDVEYMGRYLAMIALFNDVHHISGDNFKMIYDFKSAKFFPIFRQENGSIIEYTKPWNKDDIYFNNYTNLNKLIFHKSLPEYRHATNTAILKTLLSNNSVRNARDKILNKIVKEEKKYGFFLTDVHKENAAVLYSSKLSRRNQYLKEKQQLEVFAKFCNYSKKYLNYAHVYGSFNLSDSTLNVITDVFCQVMISSKKGLFNNCLVNGIYFDHKLDIKYNFTDIPFKNNFWSIEDLIFINNITKDTINPEHIHINTVLEETSKEIFYN